MQNGWMSAKAPELFLVAVDKETGKLLVENNVRCR